MFKKKNIKDARFFFFFIAALMLAWFVFNGDTTPEIQPTNGSNITFKGILFGFGSLAFIFLAAWVITSFLDGIKKEHEIKDENLEQVKKEVADYFYHIEINE